MITEESGEHRGTLRSGGQNPPFRLLLRSVALSSRFLQSSCKISLLPRRSLFSSRITYVLLKKTSITCNGSLIQKFLTVDTLLRISATLRFAHALWENIQYNSTNFSRFKIFIYVLRKESNFNFEHIIAYCITMDKTHTCWIRCVLFRVMHIIICASGA